MRLLHSHRGNPSSIAMKAVSWGSRGRLDTHVTGVLFAVCGFHDWETVASWEVRFGDWSSVNVVYTIGPSLLWAKSAIFGESLDLCD